MTRYLLLILFAATMGSRVLGLDLGIAPGISIKNAMLYAAFSAIAIESAIVRNRNVELLAVLLPFALLILYAVLTWLFIVLFLENANYSPLATLIRLKAKLVDQFLMLLVFFYGVLTLREALWLLKSLVWVMIVGCLITVVDTFNIPDLGIIMARDMDGRVQGIVGSAGEFSALLAFAIPTIVALWSMEAGYKKLFALVGIGLALVSLLLTATRGGMVSLVVGSIAAAIYLRKYISTQTFVRAAVAMVVLIFVAVAAVLSTDFGYILQERLTTGLDTGQVESISSGRTAIWSATLRDMMEFPLSFITGFGWESYFQIIGRHYATHNVYLDRLYNLGTIGLALFLLSYVNAVRIARRGLAHAPQQAAPMLIATVIGMTSFIVAMSFVDLETAAMYVWAYMGVALRIAVASILDVNSHSSPQRIDRLWSRNHTKPATRPMSFTPSR